MLMTVDMMVEQRWMVRDDMKEATGICCSHSLEVAQVSYCL